MQIYFHSRLCSYWSRVPKLAQLLFFFLCSGNTPYFISFPEKQKHMRVHECYTLFQFPQALPSFVINAFVLQLSQTRGIYLWLTSECLSASRYLVWESRCRKQTRPERADTHSTRKQRPLVNQTYRNIRCYDRGLWLLVSSKSRIVLFWPSTC